MNEKLKIIIKNFLEILREIIDFIKDFIWLITFCIIIPSIIIYGLLYVMCFFDTQCVDDTLERTCFILEKNCL